MGLQKNGPHAKVTKLATCSVLGVLPKHIMERRPLLCGSNSRPPGKLNTFAQNKICQDRQEVMLCAY